jgi:hypothetical protein
MPGNIAVGQQVTAAPVRSQMLGRGAYGDPDGAYVQMYMEEKVGTEHRIVLYLTVSEEPMHGIPPGGTISTGKGDVMTTGSDVRLKDGLQNLRKGLQAH